jgi:hypothetical protein
MMRRRKLSVAAHQRARDFVQRQHCQILLAAAET